MARSLLRKSKRNLTRNKESFGVLYDITWSCYWDEEPSYGMSDACAFRIETFRSAGSHNLIACTERPESP
ncbi:7-cyano-7-deazaguanine synthase [Halorubrum sp. N11]|uniref:7-cyano-7-deazaguanine synthase n=1 Tax=Halorubrum sp. N11 TaxID=3402276 RepID=UPI003EB83040